MMAEHNYDEAWSAFAIVMRREPDNADALLNAGICTVCRGSRVPGLEMMERAVALQPARADFHAHLGTMRRLLGRPAEAEEAFRESLRLNPDDAGILSTLAILLAGRGEHKEALRLCDRAVAIDGKSPLMHVRRGQVLAGLGRLDAARASYDDALKIEPMFGPAHQALKELG